MNRTGLLLAIAVIAVGGFAMWGVSRPTEQKPGAAEAILEGVAIVEVKLPETLSENAQIGKHIFEAKCASCHGENAAGQEGVAPPLVHKIYEPSHHSDTTFLLAAKNGVRAHHWRFGNMPPVPGVTDGEVNLVTRYVRELQRANGIH
ncbi:MULTISPECIES: c-type cytochrome [unclassified Leisingera]|uniref:c-type cytochrome n=1 Tax=unclassified Leisingera TaxID=2614906 RepID=UPI0010116BEC|nr:MULTISPECIES: cytochrome c [unclassified Leisingera]MCF6433463.1 cytochrome c [Leisingera sp. MMG026]QAX28853.1 c-type cytochrome [Leisingera sp. NJS204]